MSSTKQIMIQERRQPSIPVGNSNMLRSTSFSRFISLINSKIRHLNYSLITILNNSRSRIIQIIQVPEFELLPNQVLGIVQEKRIIQ